jgi:aerobic-type carbon monoxide dehydrogenase small subunit (CoxS/CutS family)
MSEARAGAIGGREVVRLSVNGQDRELLVKPYTTLMEVLREDLRLTGTKHGCEAGECGACTVLVDDVPKLSCLVLPAQAEGTNVTTIEGVADGSTLHPVQQAFMDAGAVQCGYCTPGMVLTAKALLDVNPAPTRAQITEALSGNLCRCTGYGRIVEAVQEAGRALARR